MAFDKIWTTDFDATVWASDWQERLPTLKFSVNTLNLSFFFKLFCGVMLIKLVFQEDFLQITYLQWLPLEILNFLSCVIQYCTILSLFLEFMIVFLGCGLHMTSQTCISGTVVLQWCRKRGYDRPEEMVISIWDLFLIFCHVMQDVQGNNSNYSVHFFHTSETETIF